MEWRGRGERTIEEKRRMTDHEVYVHRARMNVKNYNIS